jgi:two-component system LytT family sensor kinase
MSTRFTIPKYTSKDFPILVASMLPMAILTNYFLYDSSYFQWSVFLPATAMTFALLAIAFLIYGFVAIYLRFRFPEESQVFKRLGICILLFLLMSLVYISLMLRGYDYYSFLGYEFRDYDFTLSFASMALMNIFLTFLNEGVYRFEKYRNTITETEQLKKEYMHSQLLGLKSQMNPHFLFNSLNTLSSLIQEDADQAEDFLDHMSKVYRYLLRNNEEQLVSLETELNFLSSYYFLLKARHAEALVLETDVPKAALDTMLPPLTLQMIIENVLSQNSISRQDPLIMKISFEEGELKIMNTDHPKFTNVEETNESLDNIANKFRLLCQREPIMETMPGWKIIRLPLIENELIET